jgi:NDP-sugar pyrophosphorylase family protein
MSQNNPSIVGVILAAGLGNRLRPSTLYCPKPLIPVAGVEPLFFALYQFHKLGIKRVIINIHYLPTQIAHAVQDWKNSFEGMEIRISYEMTEILGTGGALLKIAEENVDWLSNSGILLQNGDTLAYFDLAQLYKNSDESALAICFRKELLEKYNPLLVDQDNYWMGIGKEAPENDWHPAHFFGVHYLSPAAVASFRSFCGEIRFVDLFNGIYRPLSNQGFRFRGEEFLNDEHTHEFWFDMNNKEFLLGAQSHILHDLQKYGWGEILKARHPGIQEVEKGIWVKSAHPQDFYTFQSPVIFIDENTSFSKGEITQKLHIGPSVSWWQDKSLSGEKVPLSTKNAVVMLKKSWQHDIPHEIADDIILA